jgi:hypothetical protein
VEVWEVLVVVEIFKKILPFIVLSSGCVFNSPIIQTKELTPQKKLIKVSPPITEFTKKVNNSEFRPDPFESFNTQNVDVVPVKSLVLNRRLASWPNAEQKNYDISVPLPYYERRIAGIINNGGISAILETIYNGQVYHSVVSPGSKVPSGIPNLFLNVDMITNNYLILSSEDGRKIKVNLSGASPDLLRKL